MSLLVLADAQLAFGHVALLDHAELAIEANERIGLIGRNGTGKSSLLKILGGLEKADGGELRIQQNLRLTYLPQEPELQPDQTIFEAVSQGVQHLKDLRAEYETLVMESESEAQHARLDVIQSALDSEQGWAWEQQVETQLERLKLPPEQRCGDLSGGLRKRVAIAQALITRPDLLLLDEPTNHLDLASIHWLEQLLLDFRGALMVISHDRSFLNAVCTRIVELDRGIIRSYPGNFAAYEQLKEQELASEAVMAAKADKYLAQEEVWSRKGVEGRRTKSVGRLARLDRLRQERASRRDQVGQVRLALSRGEQSGKIVAALTEVSKSFEGRAIVRDFSSTILRGDKVGLIGPNGAGKTTLLRMILGELGPDAGEVRMGTKMSVAYFDQMRAGLNLEATLEDTISPGSEWIEIGDSRKHVKSYLTDFLFSPERARSPVKSLSGGERNRLLLARLFARPANVLVLDEPTNDLDIDTLELLEGLLQDYSGTVFLVSHDRSFLDNVVTSLLAYEGDGRWREYEGGYTDYEAQRGRMAALGLLPKDKAERPTAEAKAAEAQESRAPAGLAEAGPRPQPLNSKEKRELEGLPAKIETLEAQIAQLQIDLAAPELYARGPEAAAPIQALLSQAEKDLATTMSRWEGLMARAA